MRHRHRPRVDELIAECEAVLRGAYAEHLAQQGRSRPCWVWINLLAHGDEAELAAESDHDERSTRPRGSWMAARGFLAAELLDAAARRGSLVALQRQALVPLELELMAGSTRLGTPRQLVAEVLTRLARAGVPADSDRGPDQ